MHHHHSVSNDNNIRIVRLQYEKDNNINISNNNNNNNNHSTTNNRKPQNKNHTNNKNNYYIWQNVTHLLSYETTVSNHNKNDLQQFGLWVCVGAAAESFITELLLLVSSSSSLVGGGGGDTSGPTFASLTEEDIDHATIRSVKRTILNELLSPTTTTTTPLNQKNHPNRHTTILIPIRPLGCNCRENTDNDPDRTTERRRSYYLDAITIAAIMLQSIRRATRNYLQSPKIRHHLGLVPWVVGRRTTPSSQQQPPHFSCGIGTPVMASWHYRSMLQMAATRAGYHTTIGITESTAAAMAYGLSFVVAASTTTTTTTLSSSLSSQPTTTTHPSTTTASTVTTKTTTTSEIPN